MIFNIVFDIILCVFLLIGLIIGYKNGIMAMIFKRLRGIGAIVLSVLLTKPVVRLFEIDQKIQEPVRDLLIKYIGTEATAQEIPGRIPTVIKGLAQLFGTDLTSMAHTVEGEPDYLSAFANLAAEPLARVIAMVGTFILLFVVLWLALWIVGRIVCVIFKLPVLKQINAFLGAVVVFAFFAIIVWAFT